MGGRGVTRLDHAAPMTLPPLSPAEHLDALRRYRDTMRAFAQDLLRNDWVTAQEHTDQAEHLYLVMQNTLRARGQ